jgi:hypothetical protein
LDWGGEARVLGEAFFGIWRMGERVWVRFLVEIGLRVQNAI